MTVLNILEQNISAFTNYGLIIKDSAVFNNSIKWNLELQ